MTFSMYNSKKSVNCIDKEEILINDEVIEKIKKWESEKEAKFVETIDIERWLLWKMNCLFLIMVTQILHKKLLMIL